MALLKHPLTRLGLDAFAVRRAARALEIAVFRDVYMGQGLDGIAAALARAEADVADGRAAPDRREAPVARRLEGRPRPHNAPQGRVRATHSRVCASEASSRSTRSRPRTLRPPRRSAAVPEAEDGAASPLWQEEAGTAASAFFTGLIDPALPTLSVRAADYADLYRSLIAGRERAPARRRAPAPLHLGARSRRACSRPMS